MYTITSTNRLSRGIILESVLSLCILFAVCVIMFVEYLKTGSGLGFWIMAGLLVATVLGCAAYMPREVILTDDALTIRLLWIKRVIPRKEIINMASIDRRVVRNSARVFGIGGLLGMVGHFRNKELGSYRRYTTCMEDLVLVQTSRGRKYVVNACQEMVDGFAASRK